MALVRKILETTIPSGSSSATFTDSDIPNSLIRVYSTNSNIYPQNISLSGNTLTVTYEAVTSALGVAVELVKQGLEIDDNLTSDNTDHALSAYQGKVLKGLIDDIVIPDVPENITDLDDVDITDIEDGQVLAWDEVTEKFVNVTQSGGGNFTQDTLWSGTLSTESGEAELSASYAGYDEILIKWSAYSDGSAYQRVTIIPTSVISNGILYQFCDSILRNTSQYAFITFGFDDYYTLVLTQVTRSGTGVGSGAVIQQIIGRKY